ncbi:MAG: glycosyltransferase [Arcobacter sp.]|nr:glycosyltransferase [Arcobacter sp.]
MKPLISVIIPVYNTEKYLEEAIGSVLQQKNYVHEIIIVNDGSTDGSAELLDKLYGNLEFVKIIHKENEGQGVARNIGTNISTGNFIYYFDSDDIIKDELFEKFFFLLTQNSDLEIFCFSGKSFLDGNYTIENTKNIERAVKRNIEAVCSSGEEAFTLLSKNKSFYVYPWLYIFKKNILLKNNISFKPIKNEDGEFIHHLFLHASKTIISNDININYRIRFGSTMQIDRSFKDLFGLIKSIESLEQLAKLDFLKEETKVILKKKITSSIRDIITIKARNKIKMHKDERTFYRKFYSKYVLPNLTLLIFTLSNPIEYKLRKLKQQYFR